MNTVKIFEKLHSVNAQQQKIELSIDDILRILNELKSLKSKIKNLESDANSTLKKRIDADDEIQIIKKAYVDNKSNIESIGKPLSKYFNEIKSKAKEIGVNINDLPVYKDYGEAINLIRELSSENQNVWNKLYKYSS